VHKEFKDPGTRMVSGRGLSYITSYEPFSRQLLFHEAGPPSNTKSSAWTNSPIATSTAFRKAVDTTVSPRNQRLSVRRQLRSEPAQTLLGRNRGREMDCAG